MTRKLSRRPCPPFALPPPRDRNPARPTHASAAVGECVVHERTTPAPREARTRVCVCACESFHAEPRTAGKSHDVGLRRSRMLRGIICQLCVHIPHRMRSSCRMRGSDGILALPDLCGAIFSRQVRTLLQYSLSEFGRAGPFRGF